MKTAQEITAQIQHYLSMRLAASSDRAKGIESIVQIVITEREKLSEENAYLKLQRDRLLEIAWLDLPAEPHESTARWAEEFEKSWIRREPAQAQVAELQRDRENALGSLENLVKAMAMMFWTTDDGETIRDGDPDDDDAPKFLCDAWRASRSLLAATRAKGAQ